MLHTMCPLKIKPPTLNACLCPWAGSVFLSGSA